MYWFLSAVVILFTVVFTSRYIWKIGRKDRARISFDKFRDLYSKKPQCWTLYGNCVKFSSYPDSYFIEFESYLDFLKYRRFRKEVAKEKQVSNQKDLEEELNKSYGEVKE